jgi:hypothetical protein
MRKKGFIVLSEIAGQKVWAATQLRNLLDKQYPEAQTWLKTGEQILKGIQLPKHIFLGDLRTVEINSYQAYYYEFEFDENP